MSAPPRQTRRMTSPDVPLTGRCFGDGDPALRAVPRRRSGACPSTASTRCYERFALEAFQSGPRVDHDPAQAARVPDGVRGLRPRGRRGVRRRRRRAADGRRRHRAQPRQDRGDDRQRPRPAGRCTRRAARSTRCSGRTRPTASAYARPADLGRRARRRRRRAAALAKELKALGFRFVGPVTAYAAMQACGVVDDHLATCPSVAGAAAGDRSARRVRFAPGG